MSSAIDNMGENVDVNSPELAELIHALSSAAVVEESVLEELSELASTQTPDPVTDVVNLFLSDSPPRLDGLFKSWELKDWPEMRNHAHALKGSASNLGARRLMLMLSCMDRGIRSGKPTAAEWIMPRIKSEFDQVTDFLEVYITPPRS